MAPHEPSQDDFEPFHVGSDWVENEPVPFREKQLPTGEVSLSLFRDIVKTLNH